MKEFFIENDGIRLHAKLDMPENIQDGSGECPLVIVIHGCGGLRCPQSGNVRPRKKRWKI